VSNIRKESTCLIHGFYSLCWTDRHGGLDEYMETLIILLDEKFMEVLSRAEEDLEKGRFREAYL